MACVLRWRQAAALLLALLALAGSAQALFVIEKGALKIKFPRGAAQAHREGFDVSMANFGSPKYGGELMCVPQEQACWGIACFFSKAGSPAHDLTYGSPRCSGKLVYPDKEHGHPNTCVPSCNFACQNFSVSGLMCYLLPPAPGRPRPAWLTALYAWRRARRLRSSSTTRRSLGRGRITSCSWTEGHVRALPSAALMLLCSRAALTAACPACADRDDMQACKFAEKVWNAQEAGAQGVRIS